MRQIRLIIVGVLLLWMNFSIFGIIAQETQPEVPTTKKVEIQQYFPHEPIVISSDSEFESQGFPGSGTYGDPYLIEGFNITSTTGSLIEIRSTETHFTLRNNFLNGLSTALSGIVFNSVRNGRIENNIIKNHISDGIFVQISNDIVITNNTIYENSIGIELEGAYYSRSHNITIRKNTISNNINGIKSYLSGGDAFSGNWITGNQVGMLMNNNLRISNISSNIISDNFQQGIIFANIIHPLFISSNTILNNGYEGIYTSSSNQIIFFNNTISNNGNEGLLLSDSSDCSVLNNTFSNNNGYGVRLDKFTQNITISGNYFTGNNPWGGSQAQDDGISNSFENNFWDDWTNTLSSYPIDRTVNYQERTQTSHRENFSTLPNHNTNVIVGICILGISLSVLIVGFRKQR